MDHIKGVLGLTALTASSLAFLFFLKTQKEKTRKEGFDDPVPGLEGDQRSGQSSYNPLSQMLNPFANGLLAAGSDNATQEQALKDAKLALGGSKSDYVAGNKEVLQTSVSKYFMQPRTDPKNGIIDTIQFCKQNGSSDNPFSNERFAANCGVCLMDGTDEEGNRFEKGQRGLFLYPKEKEAAVTEKTEKALTFIKIKPSLASCSSAPDQPVFATNATDLRQFKERMRCQKDKSAGLDTGCGICMGTTTYTYVDSTSDKVPISLILRGRGMLTATVAGKQLGDATKLSDSTNTVIDIPATDPESSSFELLVSPEKEKDPYPYIYGYLDAKLPNSGKYQISIHKIATSDVETSSRPRFLAGSYVFPTITVSKLRTGAGKTQMRLSGVIPFTFLESDQFATFDCRTAPFQTKLASLTAFSADPCTGTGVGPGNYPEDCLQQRILDAGCTNSGTLYQNPAQLNVSGGQAQNLDQITALLTTIQSLDRVTTLASAQCSGSLPPTPCEEALKDGTKPISAECLNYLYLNKGTQDARIGPSYSGNANYSSKDILGNLTFCIPSGKLSPLATNGAPNTDAVSKLQAKGLQGGIQAVQAFLNQQFTMAVDPTKQPTDPSRKAAIEDCFLKVENLPAPSLAPPPSPQTLVVPGNATANMSTAGLSVLGSISGVDDYYATFTTMPFNFFGTTYTTAYWATNHVIGFGAPQSSYYWGSPTFGKGFLLGQHDRRTTSCHVSPVQNVQGVSIVNIVYYGQNFWNDGQANVLQWQMRIIKSPTNQYIEVRTKTGTATAGLWNVSDGSSWMNTFPNGFNATAGQSFVLSSDSAGAAWTFTNNSYVNVGV